MRILNPVPHGAAYIGPERAERYVKVGRAEWMGNHMIKFLENDSRYQAVMEASIQSRLGYDARGSMTLKEIGNIPVLNPQKLRR